MSVLRINALENPLSIIEFEIAINMAIIAIMPYSAGVSRRASTNPTRNETPELEMLSAKLHPTPLTVLCFKDSLTLLSLLLLSINTFHTGSSA